MCRGRQTGTYIEMFPWRSLHARRLRNRVHPLILIKSSGIYHSMFQGQQGADYVYSCFWQGYPAANAKGKFKMIIDANRREIDYHYALRVPAQKPCLHMVMYLSISEERKPAK